MKRCFSPGSDMKNDATPARRAHANVRVWAKSCLRQCTAIHAHTMRTPALIPHHSPEKIMMKKISATTRGCAASCLRTPCRRRWGAHVWGWNAGKRRSTAVTAAGGGGAPGKSRAPSSCRGLPGRSAHSWRSPHAWRRPARRGRFQRVIGLLRGSTGQQTERW